MKTNEEVKQEAVAALMLARALAEAVREVGEAPEGVCYAAMMGRVTLGGFKTLVNVLQNAGLVRREPGHTLRWVGPAKEVA